MDSGQLFWLSIIVCIVGLLFLGAVEYLAHFVFGRLDWNRASYFELLHFWERELSPRPMADVRKFTVRTLLDSVMEHLTRRNEVWIVYGQIVATLFIVLILAVLMLTRTISAEAGLPILSGVSGFAIARGGTGLMGPRGPREPIPAAPPAGDETQET